MAKVFTREEVAKMNGEGGAKSWVIVNGDVLDVTMFAGGHPGGEKVLLDYAGKDCTDVFYSLHRHEVLERRLQRLKVGELKGYDKKNTPPSWVELSRVPYAEINMDNSPFWNDSHKRLRLAVRKFLWESGTYAWCDAAEDSGEFPPADLRKKHGRAGLLAMCLGKGPHLKLVPEPNIWTEAGIKTEELDEFHLWIVADERTRMVCPGAEDGLVSGISIGLGPLIHFGQPWMMDEIIKPVIMGDKVICLAITEPQVGSDVAGATTVGRKSADGSHWIVNGTKKWITNSLFADYATTLVRTGDGKGADALSLMVIDLKAEGVTVRKIPTDYSIAAGTGLISFENVKVPVRNLLGKEGQGMALTMSNFNRERTGICCVFLGRSRRIIEECFLWANQRKTFGKRLIDQPVIRYKLGNMVSHYNSCFSELLLLQHQYNTIGRAKEGLLGGPTALLKFRTTRAASAIADDACQIVGGRAITRTGMGKSVSRFQKSFKAGAIYGGSEEVMVDLGVRQALKTFPKNARL